MEVDGGDYSKVKLLNMDVGDIVATLGDVADATWVYENWENQVLLEAGKEINYFNLGDVDPIFDFCAPAMAAARETLEQKPDAVRRFLSVLDRAYREVAADPDRTGPGGEGPNAGGFLRCAADPQPAPSGAHSAGRRRTLGPHQAGTMGAHGGVYAQRRCDFQTL